MQHPGKCGNFVIPISFGSTEVVETGKWGYQKPEPVSRMAPCREGCPAGNPIVEFLSLAAEGKNDQALQALLKENPFPGVCGRVCFHPCESHCNRRHYDEPVSIQAMERYVFDAGSTRTPEILPRVNGHPRRAVCVGSGPAGLSFAYFFSLLGHHVEVLEELSEPGGVMRWGSPDYRLPKSVLQTEVQRIRNLGVGIRTGVKVGRDLSFEQLGGYDVVFLSPGAGLSIPLGVEGESLAGVLRGVDFLRRISAGERTNLGDEVLVIGGGNTAMDVARSARRLGTRVTVVYRRTRSEMPAIPDEVEEAEEEGVRFEFLSQPVEVARMQNDKLAVTLQRMRLSAADLSNRPRPVPIEWSAYTLVADHVITAVGEQVDSSWLPSGLIGNGLIQIREGSGRIFAGGDAIDQPRTIATAIAAGKRAAISADLHFKGMAGPSISMGAYLAGDPELRNSVVPYDRLNTLYFEPTERVPRGNLALNRRLGGFQEVNLGISAAEAVRSAARCFSCGTCNYCGNCYCFCPEGAVSMDFARRAKSFDRAHCKGCGTCAQSCPRGAIEMKEDA